MVIPSLSPLALCSLSLLSLAWRGADAHPVRVGRIVVVAVAVVVDITRGRGRARIGTQPVNHKQAPANPGRTITGNNQCRNYLKAFRLSVSLFWSPANRRSSFSISRLTSSNTPSEKPMLSSHSPNRDTIVSSIPRASFNRICRF